MTPEGTRSALTKHARRPMGEESFRPKPATHATPPGELSPKFVYNVPQTIGTRTTTNRPTKETNMPAQSSKTQGKWPRFNRSRATGGDQSDIRDSVNEAARVARSNMIFMLVVSIYLAILIALTDDMTLLREGSISLPLMQVELPIVTFYMMAPWLFLLLHFHQLIRLSQLAEKVKSLKDHLQDSIDPDACRYQSTLILPFDFSRMMLSRNRPAWWIEFAIVSTLVGFVPIFLLLCIQLRFVAYQNEELTVFHQIAVVLDIVMLTIFAKGLTRESNPNDKLHATQGAKTKAVLWIAYTVLSVVVILFSWCIAVVPDGYMEDRIGWRYLSAVAFGDWWYGTNKNVGEEPVRPMDNVDRRICGSPHPQIGDEPGLGSGAWTQSEAGFLPFRRYLDVRGVTISSSSPLPEEIGGLRAASESLELAWGRVDRLDLADRFLHRARFTKSVFRRVDLTRAKLLGADMDGAHFHDVNLERAILHDADIQWAKFFQSAQSRVEMSWAKLNNACLWQSEFYGTNLYNTDFTMTNFGYAKIHGANMKYSVLENAVFIGTKIFGTNLTGAKLYNTNFLYGQIAGTNFTNARLFRTTFISTTFQGANMPFAELYGVDFNRVHLLDGTNFVGARLYGTAWPWQVPWELKGAVDFRGTTWSRPEDWSEVEGIIRQVLRADGVLPRDVAALIDDIHSAPINAANQRDALVAEYSQRCLWYDDERSTSSAIAAPEKCWNQWIHDREELACRDGWIAHGLVEGLKVMVLGWGRKLDIKARDRALVVARRLRDLDLAVCPEIGPHRSMLRELLDEYERIRIVVP